MFCERVLEAPDLARDPRFSANSRRTAAQDELGAIIRAAFAGLSAAEVVARLEATKIASARMNDMHDVWKHPQLAARGRWTEMTTPAGPVPALLPPTMREAALCRGVPALGEHTNTLLEELGCERTEIERLRELTVV